MRTTKLIKYLLINRKFKEVTSKKLYDFRIALLRSKAVKTCKKKKLSTQRGIKQATKKYYERVRSLASKIEHEYLTLVMKMYLAQSDSKQVNLVLIGRKLRKERDIFRYLMRVHSKNKLDKLIGNSVFIKGLNKNYIGYNSYNTTKSIVNIPINEVLSSLSKAFKGIARGTYKKLKYLKPPKCVKKLKKIDELIVSVFIYVCKLYYVELFAYNKSVYRWKLLKSIYRSKKNTINAKGSDVLLNRVNAYDTAGFEYVKVTFKWARHETDALEPTIYNTLIHALNPLVWLGNMHCMFVRYCLNVANEDARRRSNSKELALVRRVEPRVEIVLMHYNIDTRQYWVNKDIFVKRYNFRGMEGWYIRNHMGPNKLIPSPSEVDRCFVWGVNTDLNKLIIRYNNWTLNSYYTEWDYKTSYINYLF